MIKRGTQNIIKLYRGAKEIIKAFRGTNLVYSAASACLTFASDTTFTFWVYNQTKNWDGTLEYSTNGATWTVWDGVSSLTPALSGGEYKLYLRGEGNTVLVDPVSSSTRFVINGSDVSCSGNIESLLDHKTVERGGHPEMGLGAFFGLFYRCAALISCPILGSVSLTNFCYCEMFAYTGITELPALPATNLPLGCYVNMFKGCTGIKVSETQEDEYNTAWRIPSSGTGVEEDYPTTGDMLKDTGGTFTGTPDINTTYYYASNAIGIYIYSLPAKTVYEVGEELDLTGCIVMATYADGSEEIVTEECLFNPGSGDTLDVEGTVTVDVTFTNGRTTLSDTFDVEVTAAAEVPTSIYFSSYPVRVDIDPNTMLATVEMNDGTMYYDVDMSSGFSVNDVCTVMATYMDIGDEDVTDRCSYSYSADPQDQEDIEVTAEYMGFTDTVQVTVTGVTVCLSGDTLISMPDGTAKRLDEIEVGDMVLAANGSSARVTKLKRGVFVDSYTRYVFEGGTVINEMGPHRFYNAEQGFWQHLKDWNIGEHAVKRSGERVALVSKSVIEERGEQFGMWTASQDYYANGLLSGDAAANARLIPEATPELIAAMLASLKDTDASEII